MNDKGTLGFLAQDVETLLPHAVYKISEFGYNDLLTLNYTPIYDAQYAATQKLIQLYEERSTILKNVQDQYENAFPLKNHYDTILMEQTYKLQTLQSSYNNLLCKASTLEAYLQSLSQPQQE